VRVTIRLADPDADADAVAAIYAPAVATPVSFEELPPDGAEMTRRMRVTLARTPWLVAVGEGGEVVGYAYAGAHRDRAAYRWSVDISAYVAAACRGRGVGRRLYGVLIPILRRQGFVNVYAGITLPNPASVRLHEAIGMSRIGVYRGVGYKLGAWHDVAWFGLRLTADDVTPFEPIPLPALATRHAKGMQGPIGYVEVADIRARLRSFVEAGARERQEVTDVGGGKLIAWVEDADSNLIGLQQMP
jgi:L-amino acid N-acyltransferase YncA